MLGELKKALDLQAERIEFIDKHNADCFIQTRQKNILIGRMDSAYTNESDAMLLNRDQVSDLVDMLTNWLNTGTFSQEG